MTRKLKRPIALLLSAAMLVTMMFTGAFAITASAATTGDVTFTALSCSEPSAADDCGFANLFYGKYTADNGTKWYIDEYTGYCYIFFKASEAVHVNGYSLYTGDNFGNYKFGKANPETWTLYASNNFKIAENADYNSSNWQKLDVVEGADLPETDYTEYKRELASQTTIKYEYFVLKLEMTGNNKWTNFSNSGWSLQLGEVVMDYSTCDHTYVDGTCSSCGMTQPTGAPDKGDGSKSNPFEIGTLEQLEWFSAYVGDDNFVENSYAYAKLVDDITLNEGLLDENGDPKFENPKSWSAIENFKGEFDGQNHTISGLYVLGYVNDYKFGLFSSITGAKISNVKVVDSYYEVCNYIGGIVGQSSYGTIDNCHFSGTIKSGGDCIGGIVGINAENSIVKNCTFNGKVKGTNYVGGIAGKSYSDSRYSKTATTIRHCTSNGSVLGEQFVGGICGSVAQYCNDENYPPKAENRSRVSYCENYAEVTSYFSNSDASVFYTSDAGGIAGEAYQAVVESSSNYGTVTSSKNNCGGIVGSMNVNNREDCCTEVTGCYNGGTVQFKKYEGVWDSEEKTSIGTFGGLVGSASSNSIIKNCYTDGVVIGTADYHGVLFGRASSTTVSNCYANQGLRKRMTNEGGTYVAEDWFDSANSDYPGCEFIDASAENSIIKTGELAYKLGGEWGQTVDAGNKYTIIEEKPVVGGAAVFYSNKNGRYHNHTGLNYNSNSWCAYCYNAKEGNAEYKPTQVDGVYQISTAEELCWFAHNCANTTEDAVLTNDISINNRVVNEDGTLAVDKSNLIMWCPIGGNRNAYYYDYQCYKGHFDGQGHTVSGLFLEEGYDGMGFFGGIDKDGVVENLNITDSYFAYSGSTYGYVGGVCGINRGKINNCTFSGVVTGKNYVGGIVGGIIGVTGYALEYDVEITNCTNYGKISGEYSVGGVCGYSEKRGSIINCSNKIGNNAKIGSIYSGEITGKSNLGGVCGTAYGKTSECYNECTVTGDGDYVGGIVGVTDHQTYTDDNGVSTSKSVLEKSVNTRALYPAEWDSIYSPKYSGPISGGRNVGGVCGGVYSEGIIRNCYNINQQVCGVKSGITNIGGLVGNCFSKSVVESCYNYCADFTNETAVMIVNNPQDKYFFGSAQDAECIFKNNYYYVATLTEGCDSQASGASFATKEQFASGEVAYHAQLGQNIDLDAEASDYPKLDYPTFDGPTVYRNITAGITCEYGYFDECEYSNTDNQTLTYLEHAEGEVYDGYCDYCHIVPIEPIQDEKGYKIGGAGHLIWLSQHTDILTADSKVYLANDIDFNKEQVSVIGNSEHPFTGTFDGEGHTIKNYSVTVNDECPNNQGLFGYVKDGTVKNVTIDSSNLYFKYSGYTATTLKGSEYSTFIAHLDNSTVESCNVNMSVSVPASTYGYFKRVAAVAAVADNNSVVKNCTASGYFSSSDTCWIKLEE